MDMRRETQLLNQDELTVYEGVTVLRHTTVQVLSAATGLDPPVVARAVDHLAALEFLMRDGARVELGPNDWDLPDAEG